MRPAIQRSISSSIQATVPSVSSTALGNPPARACRQIVVFDRPVSSFTFGSRINRRRFVSFERGASVHSGPPRCEEDHNYVLWRGVSRTPSPILATPSLRSFLRKRRTF